MNFVRVVVLASAAWTFAIAACVFEDHGQLVAVAVGVACTASVWVIALHVAQQLKREILRELTGGSLRSVSRDLRR